MITFEWINVKRENVIDSRVLDFNNQRVASCFEGMKDERIEKIKQISIMIFFIEDFDSVHRTRRIVSVVRRGLGDFPRYRRGNEGRDKRNGVGLSVVLRKPERLNSFSLVDETISDSLR